SVEFVVLLCVFILALLFFFFYLVDGPIDLRSFPTRRSSDLCGALLDRLRDAARERRHQTVGRADPAWPARIPAQPASRGGVCDQDRKSTRLNSSHVSISYAVFCLKKKKHQAIPHVDSKHDAM